VRVGEAGATLIKRSRGRSHAGKHNKPRSSAPRDTGAAVGYCISIRVVNAVRLGQSKSEHRSQHSTDETDQKQTRSSTPGQPKRMTNVLRQVIAILTINGRGGVVDSVEQRTQKNFIFFEMSGQKILRKKKPSKSTTDSI
jgi:hypothetical protein